MRTKREIELRLHNENDAFVIEVLRWVLQGSCDFCEHKNRKEMELEVHTGDSSPAYLEGKYNWADGTVMHHMDYHMEYDPAEAKHVEEARSQSINTLDAAEDIVLRIQSYLDELEIRKEEEGGITSEFVTDAARLIGQANTSLKLGVDSQLLLAQLQMSDVSRILVDVLGHDHSLLDSVEKKLNALSAPVIDVDYKEVE